VTLVQQTLAEPFVAEPIERLIGDNAYDSDQLDRGLAATDAPCAAIGADGKSNASSPGCKPSDAWPRATDIRRIIRMAAGYILKRAGNPK
jgi:hypothetical protein